jgi:Tol biopolymer transport system component
VGGSGSAVVHAVLHETPAPLTHFRPEVPAELERIISRMLAKDPEQRPADAAEALADLRSALGLPATGSLSPSTARRSRRRLAWGVLGAIVLATGMIVGFLAWRRSGATPVLVPGQITRLTDLEGNETTPSLSPDGTFFVYVKLVGGNFDLFLQRVAGGNPRNLTEGSPADDIHPAFSPDGQQIAFRSEREGGGIFVMGATGESPRRLTDFGYHPAWSPDGREIAVATERVFTPRMRYAQSQIFRIDVATGAKRSLAVRDGVQPSWSPHGSRIAFWGVAEPGARRVIWTIPADGGPPVPVVDDAFYNWSPAWSPDGGFLYFASDRGGSMNLWRVALDETSGRVLGAPQPVTTSTEWAALPSLSRDGHRLVYATDNSRSFVELVPFDPKAGRVTGPAFLAYQGARGIYSCDVSPDGEWLALWATCPTEDLLLSRADGSELRELTSDHARDQTPYWSPDGSRILFSSNRSGKYEAWTIRPDGSGLTQITNLPEPVRLAFWAPDGRRIGFRYGSHGTVLLDLLGLQSRPRELPAVESGLAFVGLGWSEDGSSLAGVLTRQDGGGGPGGILLWSYANGIYRRLTPDGSDPVFFQDGKRILFREAATLGIVDVASGEVRTVLAPPPQSWFLRARFGPGDRHLCTVRTTDEGDIWSLELIEADEPSGGLPRRSAHAVSGVL